MIRVHPTESGGRRVVLDGPYLKAVIEDGKVLEWTPREPGPRFTVPEGFDPATERHGCCDPPLEGP